MKMKIRLNKLERTFYSQSGEDGVLDFLLSNFDIDKNFVEFGVEDGSQCNTKFIRNKFSMQGLWMDMGYSNPALNLHQERVTRSNILQLFEKHNIPKKIGVLSIDIDGNDFYVLKEILKEYTPQIIVLEYNAIYEANEDKIIEYDEEFIFDGSDYFGASLLSFTKLCNSKDYSLIYTNQLGVNAFYIHNSLLSENVDFENINDVDKLYNPYRYVPKPGPDSKQRKHLKFDEVK